MDPLTTALGLIFTVIAVNHIVMRIEWLARIRAVYLAIQSMNAAFALGILVIGIPGTESMPLARYVLSMLFVSRLVMNYNDRQNHRQDERMAQIFAEQERIRAQLAAASAADERDQA